MVPDFLENSVRATFSERRQYEVSVAPIRLVPDRPPPPQAGGGFIGHKVRRDTDAPRRSLLHPGYKNPDLG
jgi:hypothetical protein